MADTAYVAVRIQGGLLPADLLSRLSTGAVEGLSSDNYHLAGETVREAANRIWAYLTGVWARYRDALAALPEIDRATGLTRERWLLILLDQLGYGRVPATPSGGLVAGDRAFPVSHVWQQVPIHLLGAGIDLDRRTPGVAGAATTSPQSLVQELLNRSDDHLWALLSNGRVLRLLRDSTSLVGSAYIEFDLEAIFEGELFSDFLLLYTLCHESRVETRDGELGPSSCWLEAWRTAAIESGSRALDHLRDGVVKAMKILGEGFLTHPANADLRTVVDDKSLSLGDFNHALLRVVYRLLFSFVAEDRGALIAPDATPEARQRYTAYFSTERLRRIARRRRGDRNGDRWRGLILVWNGLGSEDGRPELGLAAIGGLFNRGPLDFLEDHQLSNKSLLGAVRELSLTTEISGHQRIVDYRNLGAEELGSIYESLLAYVPGWDPARGEYSLASASGSERKTTGSYYTPTSLIECLLDSTLDPVLERAAKASDPEDAYLSLTVVDPACGSGHFLVAAARRIAKRIAAIRAEDPEPPPEQVRTALREVVGRCIYGVDLNPLAVELAKVSLWLEALEPGKPMAFLDAQIKIGNALIGATPSLIDEVPDEAFKPIQGDDRKFATSLAKLNKTERVKSQAGQGDLFAMDESWNAHAALAIRMADVIGGPALSLADVHVREQRLRTYTESPEYRELRLAADAWCAAFVWPKQSAAPRPVTHSVIERIRGGETVAQETITEIQRLAAEYRFFHWHLEFPHIFPTSKAAAESLDRSTSVSPETGWHGGFDVVLGNPPWERVKLQEQEFFASRDQEIARAPNATTRKRLINKLYETGAGAALYDEFIAARRRAEGDSHVLRNSGRYPLAGRGDINTYAVFAELGRDLLAGEGRLGIILPIGIATDATTQYFFRDLVESRTLAAVFGFYDRKQIFKSADVHGFCILEIGGRESQISRAQFCFFVRSIEEFHLGKSIYELTAEEILLLNPNTGTCPVFRSRRDADITLGIYRRVPVLLNVNDPINGNPWGIKFMTMFHMSNDSHLFHTREDLEEDGWVLNGNVFERELNEGPERMMPLYEAKMIHLYDTRWATYQPDGSIVDVSPEQKSDPTFVVLPRYWVHETELTRKLDGRWDKPWMLGWRWVARSTDERTMISTLMPVVPVGNSLPVAFPNGDRTLLQAVLSSFCLDYATRQKHGGSNMTFTTVMQLPVPSPAALSPLSGSITPLVERLNGWDLDDETRAHLRAEIDARMFAVFGVGRADVDYILDTFPTVKFRDIARFGEYRSKRLVLEAFDRIASRPAGSPA